MKVNALNYVLFAIIGVLITCNMDFFQQKVQANQAPIVLPQFNPSKNNLLLEIDLEKGVSNVESNVPFANVDVTVNKPAPKAEVKQLVKKEVEYVTKTEYLEKVVMFPLETPTFHIPSISRINKFER